MTDQSIDQKYLTVKSLVFELYEKVQTEANGDKVTIQLDNSSIDNIRIARMLKEDAEVTSIVNVELVDTSVATALAKEARINDGSID